MTSKSEVERFARDGYLVLEDFISHEDADEMMAECRKLVDDMNPEEHNTIFDVIMDEYQSKIDQGVRDAYFINSSDKIGFFFEKEALGKRGELLVPKHQSLNKVGHALHVLCPAFRKFTFGERMKSVIRNMGLQDPVVTQSMYIFKGAKFGGEVNPHQDGTYLKTDPMEKVIGIWLALEDATLDNGCLRFVPGSQTLGLVDEYRLIRNPQKDGPSCIYTGPSPKYEGEYVPVPIKKGSVILIDGLVFHKSHKNVSDKSRNIYTFHVYDQATTTWSDKNWLQPTPARTFEHMNDVLL